jgi:short-subunit dehydrogenase
MQVGSRAKPGALVTGASSGIGAAYAERLAADGYDVVLVARRGDRLRELAERLQRTSGARAEVLVADLADPRGLGAVEARAAGDESLVLLVNNAGFGGYRPFVDIDPGTLDDLISVHVRAVARLTRATLPGMVRRGAGGVINVASLLALSGTVPPNPLPHRATYAGAKAFIVTLTQALASELRETGVRVQVCLPGLVATEYHALVGRDVSRMPPMMAAADVVTASLAAFARGEVVCIPALDDPALLDRLSEAQQALLRFGATPTLARRYRPGAA